MAKARGCMMYEPKMLCAVWDYSDECGEGAARLEGTAYDYLNECHLGADSIMCVYDIPWAYHNIPDMDEEPKAIIIDDGWGAYKSGIDYESFCEAEAKRNFVLNTVSFSLFW